MESRSRFLIPLKPSFLGGSLSELPYISPSTGSRSFRVQLGFEDSGIPQRLLELISMWIRSSGFRVQGLEFRV